MEHLRTATVSPATAAMGTFLVQFSHGKPAVQASGLSLHIHDPSTVHCRLDYSTIPSSAQSYSMRRQNALRTHLKTLPELAQDLAILFIYLNSAQGWVHSWSLSPRSTPARVLYD